MSCWLSRGRGLRGERLPALRAPGPGVTPLPEHHQLRLPRAPRPPSGAGATAPGSAVASLTPAERTSDEGCLSE